MGFQIDDGKGKGYAAGVSTGNRLMSDAVSHSSEFNAATKGRSFIAHTAQTDDTLGIPNLKSYMLVIRNDSITRDLVISNVFLSSNTAGVVVTFDRNPTLGSLSASNVVTPRNTLFSSGQAADATVYSWNETASGIGGITAGSILNSFQVGAGLTSIPVDEAFLLGKDNIFAITTEAPTGTPEFSAAVRFHFVDREYLKDFRL